MSSETTTRLSGSDLLKNSLLYRQFQAQREEIMKHKWYESERAGHDIGFEKAMIDWFIKHGPQWCKDRRLATWSKVRTVP